MLGADFVLLSRFCMDLACILRIESARRRVRRSLVWTAFVGVSDSSLDQSACLGLRERAAAELGMVKIVGMLL